MGNRYISQAAALAFLAVWHGLHSGYYITFFNEFIVMYLEKDVSIFSLLFDFCLILYFVFIGINMKNIFPQFLNHFFLI